MSRTAATAAAHAAARAVVQRLRCSGFTAYFAGGCVRDLILGQPPKDFDVATDAPSSTIVELFERTVPVGIQFGVVLVLFDGTPIEVATFRSDGTYRDGRHPESVCFSSPEEDAKRRDFTINGMFLDPESNEIIDFVGGRADLNAGLVRAIGNPHDRLEEDRLRMLRAVRFAARLGYTLESETAAAIRNLAAGITTIAWERIGEEIVQILTQGSARRGFELLDSTGLLEHTLPEISAMKSVAQSADFHPEGDVFQHTLLLLDQLRQASDELALSALLHDVAKPKCAARKGDRITFYGHCEIGANMAVEICKRLKRSRATWERVDYLVRNHLRHTTAPEMRVSTLRRFLSEDGIDELLELCRMDAMASSKNLQSYQFCMTKLREFGEDSPRPAPLLTGRDLIQLGHEPGPLFGRILADVEERQLGGEIHSTDEAIAWVREAWPIEKLGRSTI